MTIDPIIAAIVQFGLGWLFLSAAAHKIAHPNDFRGVLAMYRLLPPALVSPAAWLVVVVEVAVGLGVLWREPIAFVVGAAVLLGYASAMGINLLRGRRFIDCGCGGTTQPLSVGLLMRNVALASVATLGVLPVSDRAVGWVDVVGIVAGVLVAALVYAAANQLLAARARLEEWV